MNRQIKVPVIEIEQPIGTFYVSALDAETLLEICVIEHWSDKKGPQRDASKKRVKEINEYIIADNDATFPTPIILSVTKDSKYILDLDENEFTFNINELKASVLDGQHRILGLKEASQDSIRKFKLPITLMFDLYPYEQAYIFSIINSKQTKVPMSIIYDLFQLSEYDSPQKTCHEIAKLLNSSESSPFYNRLKMSGKREGELSTLTQASFINYLMPMISRDPDNDLRILKTKSRGELPADPKAPLRRYFINNKDDIITKILLNLFNGLESVFSEEWNNPSKFILSKTVGYAGVMKSLPTLLKYGQLEKRLTEEFFAECFHSMKKMLNEDKIQLTSTSFGSDSNNITRLSGLIISAVDRAKG